jgi:hypothetical protein
VKKAPPTHSKTEADDSVAPTTPSPTHVAAAATARTGTSNDSPLPIVAGILLLAVGLAAVAHAARDGRS